MVPDRRRFLSICAGAFAVSTAGCLGDDSTSDDSPTGPDPEDVIAELSTYTTRLEVDLERHESAFEFDEDALDDEGPRSPRLPYVITDEQAEALVVEPEPDDIEELRSFLHETDFDEETVIVEERSVDGCHEAIVTHVRHRNGSGFSTQFCTTPRDPSVECSVEETHRQLTLVRVPESYDQVPSGSGRGSSSGCGLPSYHPDREGER